MLPVGLASRLRPMTLLRAFVVELFKTRMPPPSPVSASASLMSAALPVMVALERVSGPRDSRPPPLPVVVLPEIVVLAIVPPAPTKIPPARAEPRFGEVTVLPVIAELEITDAGLSASIPPPTDTAVLPLTSELLSRSLPSAPCEKIAPPAYPAALSWNQERAMLNVPE